MGYNCCSSAPNWNTVRNHTKKTVENIFAVLQREINSIKVHILIFFFLRICINPLCCWWLSWPIHNNAKILKNQWDPGIWVLIWEYSVRDIQWVPTWWGLDGFQKSSRSCALSKVALALEGLSTISSSFSSQRCSCKYWLNQFSIFMIFHCQYKKYFLGVI